MPKLTAKIFDQKWYRSRYTASCVRSHAASSTVR